MKFRITELQKDNWVVDILVKEISKRKRLFGKDKIVETFLWRSLSKSGYPIYHSLYRPHIPRASFKSEEAAIEFLKELVRKKKQFEIEL